MFRFLKGLGRREKAPEEMGIRDLPAWIDGEEARVREELAGLVAIHRPRVTDAVSTIKEVLARFDRGEMEEVRHQKLAGVTERSLPLFLKAMRTSLSRELPADPEGFYMATAEILKGCLSAFRGQGRYLSSRFPVEMKTLGIGVDTVGKEANAMTPRIAATRERRRALGEVRAALGNYTDAKSRAGLAEGEIRSLGGEEARSRESLESVRRAMAELEAGEEYRAVQEELTRIRRLEEDLTGTARLFHAQAATAIHLLKKGEKVASRKRHRDATRFLREAARLLEGDLPLPGDAVSRTLAPGLSTLTALAASGDIAPKNREETELLEEPGRFVRDLAGISRRFQEISAEISTAQGALSSRPALVKSENLRREIEGLEKGITQVQARLGATRDEVQDLQGRMKALSGELQQKVADLSGGRIRIREPDSLQAGE
ncbi:MAG: hypothetical protein LUO97_04500 [Methanomicrobiales archaeon]|nr:hypothetical protein [Methanomicrobiales archaeon]